MAVLGSGLAAARFGALQGTGLGHSPGEGGLSAWGRRRGRGAALPPQPGVPFLLCGMCWACGSLWRSKGSTGAAEAGAGHSSGSCVTLGSLSSLTVPCPGNPGANPLVRGFFPSFSHSHLALCWFGAAWCLPCCVSSVSLLLWLSPASSKALTPVLPSVCDQTSDPCPLQAPQGRLAVISVKSCLAELFQACLWGQCAKRCSCGCCSGY